MDNMLRSLNEKVDKMQEQINNVDRNSRTNQKEMRV
jgi:hypothetical protein